MGTQKGKKHLQTKLKRFSLEHSTYRKAFTIVELLVVIAVIAILAGVVIVSYSGWQRGTKVSQVKSDLTNAAAAMESAKNFGTGYPVSTAGTAISTVVTSFSDSSGIQVVWTTGDATSYCLDGTVTSDTTIQYYIDTTTKTPQTGTCTARTNVPIPAIPTGLAVTSATYAQLNFSWTASANASSYTIQCATDLGFITGVQSATISGGATTGSVSSLSSNTTYFCRINATDAAGSSGWSGTITQSTTSTAIPGGLALAVASPTQINYSWSTASGAASYNIQRATDSGFSQNVVTVNQTGLTGSSTGLTGGIPYYYRVQSVDAGGTAGTWSGTVSTTTISGLIGWWKLDGNANDSSSNSNNGTVSGATLTTGETSQANTAYSFNGSSTYIAIPGTWGGVSLTAATVSGWYKVAATTSDFQAILEPTDGNFFHMQLYSTGTEGVYTDASALLPQVVPQTPLGAWHFIVMSAQSGSVKEFLDNVQQGSTITTTFSYITATTTLQIGRGYVSTRYFNGSIDDVRVYNRALSTTEIQALYNAGAQ